jgi:hypothetical protein
VPPTPVRGYERGPVATSLRQGLRSRKYSPAIETAKYAKYAKEMPGVGFASFAKVRGSPRLACHEQLNPEDLNEP